MLNMAIAYDGL